MHSGGPAALFVAALSQLARRFVDVVASQPTPITGRVDSGSTGGQGVGPQSQDAATSQGQAQESQPEAEVSVTLVAAIRGTLMTLHQIVHIFDDLVKGEDDEGSTPKCD